MQHWKILAYFLALKKKNQLIKHLPSSLMSVMYWLSVNQKQISTAVRLFPLKESQFVKNIDPII